MGTVGVDNCRVYSTAHARDRKTHKFPLAFSVDKYAKSLTVTNSVFSDFNIVVEFVSFGEPLDGDEIISVKLTDNMFKGDVGGSTSPFREHRGTELKDSGHCVLQRNVNHPMALEGFVVP